MSRKRISQKTVDSVLVSSRRRCCICFGLNRDTEQKKGQIAHLDGNNANSSLENLAYLCLDHHDAVDSSPSQAKGFTMGEVKHYRAELRNAVQRVMEQEVRFGAITLAARDPNVGHFVLNDSDISVAAELDITALPDTIDGSIQYFVSGFALVGGHRPSGPNIGDFSFVAELRGNRLENTFYHGEDRDWAPYGIIIELHEEGLTLREENQPGPYGLGVQFSGEYSRAPRLDYREWIWENDDARARFAPEGSGSGG
jgi:hypothetical protein